MKRNLIILLVLFSQLTAATVPPETLARLKKLYPHQSENFLQQRIQSAKNPFDLWRAFPPYFYNLVNRMEFLPMRVRNGLCAGDPHLENFGFIYDGRANFTLNDLDDAGPCSLNADAMRLFLGLRLVSPITAEDFLAEYKSGLEGHVSVRLPAYVERLRVESVSKKDQLGKKYKKALETKTCSGDFSPLGPEDERLLKDFVSSEGKRFELICARWKTSGGSAGSKRYVFFHIENSVPRVFELKQLMRPAPLFDAPINVEERAEIFLEGVRTFLGAGAQSEYRPVLVEGILFQRRPVYGGNVGLELPDMSPQDLSEASLFEARVLGSFHSRTSRERFTVSSRDWEVVASTILEAWKIDFGIK